MTRSYFSAVVVALGVMVVAQPAYAGKSDDAWAQCLWLQAPKSAANWIAMPPSETEISRDKNPYYLLSVRLQGYCREKLVIPGKSYAPSFNAKSVRKALVTTRPESIGEDVGPSKALRCEIYEDDVVLGVSIFFGEGSGLRPRSPATSIKCQRVNDDGTLTDA